MPTRAESSPVELVLVYSIFAIFALLVLAGVVGRVCGWSDPTAPTKFPKRTILQRLCEDVDEQAKWSYIDLRALAWDEATVRVRVPSPPFSLIKCSIHEASNKRVGQEYVTAACAVKPLGPHGIRGRVLPIPPHDRPCLTCFSCLALSAPRSSTETCCSTNTPRRACR